MGVGERDRGRERIPDSPLSSDPNTGLDLMTRDHDLSQNQELDIEPTEPGIPERCCYLNPVPW